MKLPILEATILLLILVVVSNVISHYLVSVPTALIQVAIGLIIALVTNIEIHLETSWFMLLFVAPLLFNDGKHYPNKELWKLRAPIFANAILLVFIITFLGGFLIHAVVPDIPLVVSFALAAILAPTDTVAVHGIAEQAKLPPGILSLVTGESLINDASGLIAFKYAIAATVTGYFSVKDATFDFLYLAIAGGIIGFVLMHVIHFIRTWLMRQGITDVILHTSLQILTPFMIYFVTEDFFHASGVIAVVTAGLVASTQTNFVKDHLAEIHMMTEKTWDIIVYLLNGMVFLILGIELPVAMIETIENPTIGNVRAIFYAVFVWFMLLVIRTAWIYGYMVYQYLVGRNKGQIKPSFYISLISGLTGVRGAITMAGILSIPYVIDTGAFFPERSLVLFIASGVIVLSLLSAAIALPLLTKNKKRIEMSGSDVASDLDETSEDAMARKDFIQSGEISEAHARIHLMNVAIRRLMKESRTSKSMAAHDLLHEYNYMLRRLQLEQNSKETVAVFIENEQHLRQLAYEGELACLQELHDKKLISSTSGKYYEQVLVRKIKFIEKSLFSRIAWFYLSSRKKLRRLKQATITQISRKKASINLKEILFIETECANKAIQLLNEYLQQENHEPSVMEKNATYHLIVEYQNKLERIQHYGQKNQEMYEQEMHDLRLKVLAAERADIQYMYENGDISRQLTTRLRQFVNYSESSIMEIGLED